jgi:hypothetical protein
MSVEFIREEKMKGRKVTREELDAIIQEDWIKIVEIMNNQGVDRKEAEKIYIKTRGWVLVDESEKKPEKGKK